MDVDSTIRIVQLLGATSEDPKISDDELQAVIDLAVRPDEFGYLIGDPLWTPTYNIFDSLSRIWEVKASKLTQAVNMSADGQSFSLSQQFDHCLKMADRYRSKRSWSIEMQKEEILMQTRNLGVYYY